MDYWEYCIISEIGVEERVQFTISYSHKVEIPSVNGRLTVLTEMGRNGWELITVKSIGQGGNEFYFKRQVVRKNENVF